MKFSYVVGIDEVGRGPLAGPVTVCAFAIPYELYMKRYSGFRKLVNGVGMADGRNNGLKNFDLMQDSKTVKESRREEASKLLWDLAASKDGAVHFSIASKSAKDIDKFGISVCIKKLISKNLQEIMKKVEKRDGEINLNNILVLLDGSLKAPQEFLNQKTMIKGDAKEKVISCASILAKVHRDSHMKKLSKKSEFSKYNFGVHKGYGTLKHRGAIKKYGMSAEHRMSFCKKIA